MNDASILDQTFAALAHPARRAMLARLAKGHATVKELAKPFEMSLPAVSKHIRVLERAGLITQGQDAQFRPCSLNSKPLQQVADWAEQYRPIWESRFDKMTTLLNDIKEP